MKKEMILPFSCLCAVPFIMVLGNSMLIPLLPAMKSAMNLTMFQVGLIITAFSIPAGIVIPFAGYLSDRFGRKVIIAPALIIYGLGGLIAGFASLFLKNPYSVLILGRIVQGIGAGGTYQLAMAMVGDIFQSNERTKALGLLEASNGLGKVVSPIAGAALGLIIWFAPFFVYGILAIPIALAVWFLTKEPTENKEGISSYKNYFKKLGKIFEEKGVSLISSFLAGAVVLFILFGTLSYISDVLEDTYKIRGFSTGLLIAIPVASMSITSYFSGSFLTERTNLLKIAIITGLLLVTIPMAVIAFVTNLYVLFTFLVILGIGTGIVLPAVNTLITSAISSKERGIVTCLYGSTRFFGVAIGPPTFGLVTSIGKAPLFIGVAVLALLVTIGAYLFIKEKVLLPPGILQGS